MSPELSGKVGANKKDRPGSAGQDKVLIPKGNPQGPQIILGSHKRICCQESNKLDIAEHEVLVPLALRAPKGGQT